ncbi:hypothetical protein [Streptomyces sp. JJ38]|uniref:hypothetical protein n=1 Tax=Streptomyces sp. JJ38 TaxID=2738128 RepID=UPI001C564013|nr:hypothetical protein [Streptomyces sp. JJ38]
MHMNSAPHLRFEDRHEFERVLDDALHTASGRPGLDGIGRRLGSEQLRAMALAATASIASCAAAEYERFTTLREELRRSSRGSPGLGGGTGETGGAGLFAMVSVLVPILAGAAAVIFLAVGYTLAAVSPDLTLADPMRSVGWVFAALAAAGLLAACISLVLTALRNSASSIRAGTGPGTAARHGDGTLEAEVDRAREAWRSALLDRGILPFLREALANAEPATTAPEQSRTPRLGYSHPGFTSPAATEDTRTRPRYSSPDFSSPDFTGPDQSSD